MTSNNWQSSPRDMTAPAVQARLGIDKNAWLELKAAALAFRRRIDRSSFRGLSHEEKLSLCQQFRNQSTYTLLSRHKAILERSEDASEPWLSWYLISLAKPRPLPRALGVTGSSFGRVASASETDASESSADSKQSQLIPSKRRPALRLLIQDSPRDPVTTLFGTVMLRHDGAFVPSCIR